MSSRDSVLEILEENKGEVVSGGDIAMWLGISRNAVWKAVKTLQDEGYYIYATPSKGYSLSNQSDILSLQSVKHLLETRHIGRNIEVFKTVDSTNITAKTLASAGFPHGTVIISEEQTAGKGRLDRTFHSPKGTGIYMSILLKPDIPIENASLLTSCAAVAVAKSIQIVSGLETKIKWVNDIYVNRKKVSGILTEASINFENGELDYAVVGIGINCSTKSFPEDLAKKATSLYIENGKKFSRSSLIAEILNRLEILLDGINQRTFLDEYRKRSNIIGHRIVVIGNKLPFEAKAIKIDDNARLIVLTDDDIEVTLNSGEISILPTDRDFQ